MSNSHHSGWLKRLSQSQEVSNDNKKEDSKKDDDDNDDNGAGGSEDEDDQYMLLFGPDENGKYEARYFDKEGYNILDLTSKKLQVKKKDKKAKRHANT